MIASHLNNQSMTGKRIYLLPLIRNRIPNQSLTSMCFQRQSANREYHWNPTTMERTKNSEHPNRATNQRWRREHQTKAATAQPKCAEAALRTGTIRPTNIEAVCIPALLNGAKHQFRNILQPKRFRSPARGPLFANSLEACPCRNQRRASWLSESLAYSCSFYSGPMPKRSPHSTV